jgi:hypothetical protein
LESSALDPADKTIPIPLYDLVQAEAQENDEKQQQRRVEDVVHSTVGKRRGGREKGERGGEEGGRGESEKFSVLQPESTLPAASDT